MTRETEFRFVLAQHSHTKKYSTIIRVWRLNMTKVNKLRGKFRSVNTHSCLPKILIKIAHMTKEIEFLAKLSIL